MRNLIICILIVFFQLDTFAGRRQKKNCREVRSQAEARNRYNGPQYHSTSIYLKEHRIGRRLKSLTSGRSVGKCRGNIMYKVLKRAGPDFESLQKNDYFYVDRNHSDHIEVFKSSGEFSHVMNFDGTENIEKTRQEKSGGARNIKRDRCI